MNDRELFDLAAKAAGLIPTTNCNGERAYTTGQGSGCFAWNPRDDDADAFRLGVKLNFFLEHPDFLWQFGSRIETDDACADTRMAIFHAAVEIGRKMP